MNAPGGILYHRYGAFYFTTSVTTPELVVCVVVDAKSPFHSMKSDRSPKVGKATLIPGAGPSSMVPVEKGVF
jgi:hypothetical protein